ncbi:MAG: hypothetical protein GY811_30540 [Myxococcales bacterium]|nr:hypothetical protein [Myxococcales bacterium]
MEKRLIGFSVNEPYAEAAERIALQYGLEVSTNLLRCVTERVDSDAVLVAGVALHEEVVPNRPVAQDKATLSL